MKSNQHRSAFEEIEAALKGPLPPPLVATANANLGYMHTVRGELAEATTDYQKAHALQPSDYPIGDATAHALSAELRVGEARQLAQGLLETQMSSFLLRPDSELATVTGLATRIRKLRLMLQNHSGNLSAVQTALDEAYDEVVHVDEAALLRQADGPMAGGIADLSAALFLSSEMIDAERAVKRLEAMPALKPCLDRSPHPSSSATVTLYCAMMLGHTWSPSTILPPDDPLAPAVDAAAKASFPGLADTLLSGNLVQLALDPKSAAWLQSRVLMVSVGASESYRLSMTDVDPLAELGYWSSLETDAENISPTDIRWYRAMESLYRYLKRDEKDFLYQGQQAAAELKDLSANEGVAMLVSIAAALDPDCGKLDSKPPRDAWTADEVSELLGITKKSALFYKALLLGCYGKPEEAASMLGSVLTIDRARYDNITGLNDLNEGGSGWVGVVSPVLQRFTQQVPSEDDMALAVHEGVTQLVQTQQPWLEVDETNIVEARVRFLERIEAWDEIIATIGDMTRSGNPGKLLVAANARAMMAVGRYGDAVDVLGSWTSEYGIDSAVLALQGKAQANLGRFAVGQHSLEAAWYLARRARDDRLEPINWPPSDADTDDILRDAGQVASGQELPEQALKFLIKAQDYGRRDPETQQALIDLYCHLGKTAESQSIWASAGAMQDKVGGKLRPCSDLVPTFTTTAE